MAHQRLLSMAAVTLTAALAASSCGGGSDSPTAPTSETPGTVAATITITADGVSPSSVTVPAGSRVNFVNNGTRAHEMTSDPHPVHTDCPAINSVGRLEPGQSRATSNLNASRTCGFHDHLNDTNQSLRGTITVQ